MIRLDRVTRRFDGKTVISDLSFTFPDRGVFALMGPSGSGKTTLLRLLAGLDVPDGGSIESTHQKTAVAFQEHRLLPWLNCEDNLKLVLSKNKNSSVSAQEWLEAMELTDATKLFPKELSGGMKQRLSLARALCFGGDLLLLDEPFSALDKDLKQRIFPAADLFSHHRILTTLSPKGHSYCNYTNPGDFCNPLFQRRKNTPDRSGVHCFYLLSSGSVRISTRI